MTALALACVPGLRPVKEPHPNPRPFLAAISRSRRLQLASEIALNEGEPIVAARFAEMAAASGAGGAP